MSALSSRRRRAAITSTLALTLAGLTGCYEIAKLPACSKDEPCDPGFVCGADGVCQAEQSREDASAPVGDGAGQSDSGRIEQRDDAAIATPDVSVGGDGAGDVAHLPVDAGVADGSVAPDARRGEDGPRDAGPFTDRAHVDDIGPASDVGPVGGDSASSDATQPAVDAAVRDADQFPDDAAATDAELTPDAEILPDLGAPCVEADPCETGRAAPCGAGHWLCGGAIPVCAPPTDGVETCNDDRLDNDCDGVIDNVAGLGDACATGIGSCAADGFNLCDFIGEQLECGAVEGAPVAEICNALDDDCDETSDEDVPPGGGCDTGAFGVCAAGLLTCANGLQTTCTPVTAPTAEVCNGLDDNCDDTVDNLLAPPSLVAHCGECGHACDLPNAVSTCDNGECAIEDCTGGFLDNNLAPDDGCELRCRPSVPPTETCNGRDDDCDGSIDPGETCVGIFDFCARRADAGDVLCEDFPPRALDAWIPVTLIGDGLGPFGPLPVALQRHYTASESEALPAGHTRRTQSPMGGAFSVGFRVFGGADGELEAGVFDDLRDGFALRVSFATHPATAAFVAYPRVTTLGSVVLPDPIPFDGVRVEAVREAGGDWSIRLDGEVANAVPYARSAAGVHSFDRVSLSASGVTAGAARPAFGELLVTADADEDGLYWPNDLCPRVADPEQLDPDGDGVSIPCDDADGDGIEDGPDNCQIAPNVDQTDADDDGFGDACDVDGQQIGVMMATSVRPYVWRIDPVTGLRGRGLILPEGATQAVIEPANSRVLAVLGSEVRVYGPANLNRLVGASATRPQWLADGNVMYTAADGLTVFTNIISGASEAVAATALPGGHIVGYASADGRRVAMVRAEAGNVNAEVSLWLLDAQGLLAQSGNWLPLPAQGVALPWLQPHPTEARFAYASLAGESPGVGELDGVRATMQKYSAIPAPAVSYLSGSATRVVALERQADGSRIALYAGGQLAATLTRSLDGLTSDALSIVSPAAPLAWSDADGDAIEDTSDVCAGLDDQTPLTPVLTVVPAHGGSFLPPSIDFSGSAFGVVVPYANNSAPVLWSVIDASGLAATEAETIHNDNDRYAYAARVRWSTSANAFGIAMNYSSPSGAGLDFVRRGGENEPLGTQTVGASNQRVTLPMTVRDGQWWVYRPAEGDMVRVAADGTVTPVPVPQPAAGSFRPQDLSSGPGGFAMAGYLGGSSGAVYFFDTSGVALHAPLGLVDFEDYPTQPTLASNGAEWGVLYAYAARQILAFRRISVGGQFASALLEVAVGGNLMGTARVVWGGDHWGVVWTQVRNGVGQPFYARVAADGLSRGDAVPLPRNNLDPNHIDVAFTGSGYGAAWRTSTGSVLFTSGALHCR